MFCARGKYAFLPSAKIAGNIFAGFLLSLAEATGVDKATGVTGAIATFAVDVAGVLGLVGGLIDYDAVVEFFGFADHSYGNLSVDTQVINPE